MLDLFAGLGGASKAMQAAGWTVIRVDNDPQFNPDICADITIFHYSGPKPDLVWASPPCTEFSRYSIPSSWKCNAGGKKIPDMTLTLAAKRVIEEIDPEWWIVENVRGAKPFYEPVFGPVVKRCGSRYLWGIMPICDPAPGYGKWKMPPSKDRAALRAIIPIQISRAICQGIEMYS